MGSSPSSAKRTVRLWPTWSVPRRRLDCSSGNGSKRAHHFIIGAPPPMHAGPGGPGIVRALHLSRTLGKNRQIEIIGPQIIVVINSIEVARTVVRKYADDFRARV